MVKCIDKHNKFTKSLLGASDSQAVSTRTTWTNAISGDSPVCFLVFLTRAFPVCVSWRFPKINFTSHAKQLHKMDISFFSKEITTVNKM